MAISNRLPTLNEHFTNCYQHHTPVLAETDDKAPTLPGDVLGRYQQQMAEIASLASADRLRSLMDARELTVASLATLAHLSPRTVRHALAGGRSQIVTKLALSIALTPKRAA